jgi:hypothetical protein
LLAGYGGHAVGNPLYTSPVTYDGNQWQTLTIKTGGVLLSPGKSYVIGLTISDPLDYAASVGYAAFGLTHTDYTEKNGGGFVFSNNGNQGLASLNGPWHPYQNFGDLAFTATFSNPDGSASVPLPAEVAPNPLSWDDPLASVPESGSVATWISLSLLGLVAIWRTREARVS